MKEYSTATLTQNFNVVVKAMTGYGSGFIVRLSDSTDICGCAYGFPKLLYEVHLVSDLFHLLRAGHQFHCLESRHYHRIIFISRASWIIYLSFSKKFFCCQKLFFATNTLIIIPSWLCIISKYTILI